MRIIGGTFRGRSVRPDGFFSGRPTTDLAREGLFNILGSRLDFQETTVLDLFAGSGCIGLEFVSRGAPRVDAVEFSPRHAAFIRNIAGLWHADGLRVIRQEVSRFLKICRDRYTVVFADPPYDLEWLGELPGMVLSSGVVSGGGWFVLEHPRSHSFAEHPALRLHRRYGNVHFSFFAA